jgi:hypothetical protein
MIKYENSILLIILSGLLLIRAKICIWNLIDKQRNANK